MIEVLLLLFQIPTNPYIIEQNHKDVLIVVDSQDYPALLGFLQGNQDDQLFRRKLAWKAFQHVASYDSAVSEWLWKQTVGGTHFTSVLAIYWTISLRHLNVMLMK